MEHEGSFPCSQEPDATKIKQGITLASKFNTNKLPAHGIHT
jgi:hypothetical protein